MDLGLHEGPRTACAFLTEDVHTLESSHYPSWGHSEDSQPAGNCIIQEERRLARESGSIMMTGCSDGLGRARLGL